MHVADGWAARHFDDLKLRESEEMKGDRVYLEKLQRELSAYTVQPRPVDMGLEHWVWRRLRSCRCSVATPNSFGATAAPS